MFSPTIPARSRCIVALDVPDASAARGLVATLGEAGAFYKVGLELFAAGEGRGLVDELVAAGKEVFVDLKLYDVPETVARATRRVAESGARFLTVHGDDAILQAAVANKGERLGILAVTALTSLDAAGLRQLGYQGSVGDFVLDRAARALAAGCDGVICSGLEVAALREKVGHELLLVTPGVRPVGVAAGDQKRVATPAAVIGTGGDYLVVGRPVRDADEPARALQEIIGEVETALTERQAAGLHRRGTAADSAAAA